MVRATVRARRSFAAVLLATAFSTTLLFLLYASPKTVSVAPGSSASAEVSQNATKSAPPPPAAEVAPAVGQKPLAEIAVVQREQPDALPRSDALPVLLLTCSRVKYLKRSLDSILSRRGGRVADHPIIVSQDCNKEPVTQLLETEYRGQIVHLQHPSEQPSAMHGMWFSIAHPTTNKHYIAIAKHYKWALTQVFDVMGYNAVIIVEDDMEVSVDFFSYFRATRPLLESDPSLWCVSSWNDNGRPELASDPDALYRSDFFPGLGWMMTRTLWAELSPTWPAETGYWDEFMRRDDVRRGRACLRPEVSRNQNFGRHGASFGMFFGSHISLIGANTAPIDWEARDLAWLRRPEYDALLHANVSAARRVELSDIEAEAEAAPGAPLRAAYASEGEFAGVAARLGLMQDFKEGMPRTAYRGVVASRLRGTPVFLCPPDVFDNPAILLSAH